MRPTACMRWFIIALLFACSTPQPKEQQRSLPQPQHLSPTVRAVVAERMERHAFEMSNLMWAVLFLDRPIAAEIADTIVSEPRLARPLTKDASELNSALPEHFFALQDTLVQSARNLARVARAPDQDGAALSKAYGELTAVCVSCHAIFIADPAATETGANP